MLIIFLYFAIFVVYCIALEFVNPAKYHADKIGQIISLNSALQRDLIIYIMVLSGLEKLLSVWENVLSIENVT